MFLGEHRVTKKKVAIKVCPKKNVPRKKIARIRKEYTIMNQLMPHKNIIKLHQVIENDTHICIVMEYAEGGDLFQLIQENGGRLSPKKSWKIIRQLVAALLFMHSNAFSHRDLKPENVFLAKDKSTVLLGDFGFADIWCSYRVQEEGVGSLNYCSPEIISGGSYIGPEVDMWSLGAVLYAMLTGNLPFAAEDPEVVCENIKTANWSLDGTSGEHDPFLHDLLSKLLTPEPIKRAKMIDILEHPWYKYGPLSSRKRRTSEPSFTLHKMVPNLRKTRVA